MPSTFKFYALVATISFFDNAVVYKSCNFCVNFYAIVAFFKSAVIYDFILGIFNLALLSTRANLG